MSQIILDMGSGNTCKNNLAYVRRMIDELKAVDTGKHEVIIKWQLFEHAPPNERLMWATFDYAYNYALDKGYRTTASVFDMPSLQHLLQFDIPFVKIANRPDLYWLAGEVPRKIPVYVSISDVQTFWSRPSACNGDEPLWCVSKYPSTLKDYQEIMFREMDVYKAYANISDHTTDFQLWNRYRPRIIEWHYKLDDSTGPDAGEFARTPAMLAEIL
jgi:sialic acid synthase SpsE